MSSTAIAAAALPEQMPAPAEPVAVAATELARCYGEGDTCVEALRGVSLDVADDRLTAIMGASGLGKSTLMHVLAGLDRPTSGSVRLERVEIRNLPDKKLTLLRREQIVFVFQFFSLESPDPSEPELDDEAARVKRNRERLDVDDLPRAPVEREVPLTRTDTHETGGDQTRARREGRALRRTTR
jgi:ABC-type glutathione transport system ATPase component